MSAPQCSFSVDVLSRSGGGGGGLRKSWVLSVLSISSS